MNEREPRPAEEREGVDWRRLNVALGRFADRIAVGLAGALAEHREIDDGTARMIAHVLGRGYGRESELARFGREGGGDYLGLRDEYLAIYNDPIIQPVTKELIDWLGTYLVQRENIGSGRRFMNEYSRPKLEQLLVDTWITIDDQQYLAHVPGIYGSDAIEELRNTLRDLRLDQDEGLQAFLALPDVDAMSGDIMGSFDEAHIGTFRTIEDAVNDLVEIDELEKEVDEFATERGLVVDAVTPDYEVLTDRAREAFDLVEWKGRVYVFSK